jgi:tetratricopeptide (TPR) repeat protein/tRNA A-37 threonylcarbamoyl transferase component Bud32/class 3 adenylate cyclase
VTARHWDQLQELLAAVLDRAPGERVGFLERACSGKPGLKREIEELLAASDRASPLDASVAALLTPAVDEPVRPGMEILGHYQVLERLGRGGMGVVYKARDLRLERMLALKFLASHLNADPKAKARLKVEAQAAAALDHPNICTIHEIGETPGGQLFIVMSYYEGETLESRLARGAMTPDDALGVAMQVAQGLVKAHERGVVHRDIKPANLMITADGVLKVLDFGIAKLPGIEQTSGERRAGTVAYMSPEQLRGEQLDGRTDVWSLGVVLYEMLTGERLFKAANHAVEARSILVHHTDGARILPPTFPDPLDRLLARMLAERHAERYTATDLMRDLERLRRRAEDIEPPAILPDGERRRVTVLALSAADEARLRAAAADVVRRHGGLVNRVADGALEALFGVPVTHEDDPVRAVRAALDLRSRLPTARFGIHTGSAAVLPDTGGGGQYHVSGSAVGLAVELAAQAPVGDIWVSLDSRRAIAGLFGAEEVARAAPGTDDPAFRVLEAAEPRTRFEAAQHVGLTAFIGRERELSVLQDALDAAIAGDGRFVVVMGEAGMGKSRLLFELRFALARAGAGLLQGRCDSAEGGTTYRPFVEILRDWLGATRGAPVTLEAADVAGRLRALGGELTELIPLLLQLLSIESQEYPVPRHLHGEHYRLAMQEALAAFVTLVARQQPTALLLEDWHWADEASHGVLQQVAELASGFPLLVVVTSRPGVTHAWGHQGHLATVSLDPLDPGSSGSMLRSILGATTLPSGLVDLIHERTGGNPFFLEEITQTLLEEGRLAVRSGEVMLAGPLDPVELPDTVQAVIRARLDRLDRGTREVLRVAAVIGREFTRGILERIVDTGRLPHALQTLKAAGVIQQVRVVPEPVYRFKHVLTQEAALGSLLEDQRKELHGRVGAAIEAMYGGALDEQVGRLVEHFSRAEQWPRAVRYARLAAERADALSQFAESLEILERAQSWLLRLPQGTEPRDALVDILFRQERLCETLGLRGRQQRIIDELVALLASSNQPERLAEAYLRQGDLYTLLRRFDDAESTLDRSLCLRRELHDDFGERNTLRSLGLLRWHQGRDRDALGYIADAVAIDRERGYLEALVSDLASLGTVLKGMREYARARDVLLEALALSDALEAGSEAGPSDLSHKRPYILHNLANVHRELGDEERALEYLAQASTLTTEKRLPIQLSYHFTSTAHIYLRQGRVEESLALYREAVELTRRAKFVPGLAQALRFLGEVLLGMGRDREAHGPLVEAAGLFAQLHDPVTEALLWSDIAALRERAGDLQSALAAWGKARALHDRTGDYPRKLAGLEGLARVARRYLPEASLALGYYEEALGLAERLDDRPAVGRLRNAMGIIEWERGRFDEAYGHFEAALRTFQALNRTGDAATTLASLGVTLDAMGRRVEARKSLEEACTLHRAAGDRPGEARTLGALADVLRRLGEPDRAVECGTASLRLRRECGDRVGEGWMLQRLALAHVERGADTAARACAAAAERIAAETEDRELAAACGELAGAPGRARGR